MPIAICFRSVVSERYRNSSPFSKRINGQPLRSFGVALDPFPARAMVADMVQALEE